MLSRLSAVAGKIRLAYNELNFPSSKTATGTFCLSYDFGSSAVLILSSVIMAGVEMVLALGELCSRMDFRMPGALTVSMELANREKTGSRFFEIGLDGLPSSRG